MEGGVDEDGEKKEEGIARQFKRKRRPNLREEHIVRFGLKIVGDINPVLKVQCLFCAYYGREVANSGNRQRGPTRTIKHWTPPFRADLFQQHHGLQHPVIFDTYSKCHDIEKKQFFEQNQVHRFKQIVPTVSSQPKQIDTSVLYDFSYLQNCATFGSSSDIPPLQIPTELNDIMATYLHPTSLPLDAKSKTLAMIACLASQHGTCNSLFEESIQNALTCGVSTSDVLQTILQCTPIIGLSKTVDAAKIADKIFCQSLGRV